MNFYEIVGRGRSSLWAGGIDNIVGVMRNSGSSHSMTPGIISLDGRRVVVIAPLHFIDIR